MFEFECRARCSANGCQFRTPIMQANLLQKYMQTHHREVHTEAQQPVQEEKVAVEPVHAAVGRATNDIKVIKEIKDISPCQETLMPTATAAKAEKPSPQKPDNYRQAQSKQRDVITSPQESDNHRQAQSKQWGVTTDPQPEANCLAGIQEWSPVGQTAQEI